MNTSSPKQSMRRRALDAIDEAEFVLAEHPTPSLMVERVMVKVGLKEVQQALFEIDEFNDNEAKAGQALGVRQESHLYEDLSEATAQLQKGTNNLRAAAADKPQIEAVIAYNRST